MIITEKILYPAFTGDEERKLYIYLPPEYDSNPDRRYPVLYMFDGHNVFFDTHATYGKSWGLGDYLDRTGTPLIVAALECHHGPNGERISEYSPYRFSDETFGTVIGRGDETMQYFLHELKPRIDRTYRTHPDREHTFIAGSSMGGLMSLYAVLHYNAYFSRCAALSPSIFLCYKKMQTLIRTCRTAPDTTIYMDLGTEEMTMEGGSANAFANFGKLIINKDIALTQRVIAGGRHCEASWEKQIPIFINVLLYENPQY
ncbi:MAG: alpha/beta hydrolase-fold protein [Eubacteriales bacterium]|nr:alpha/beta hydrolase-fold protein [Eubacteriales bacterium]